MYGKDAINLPLIRDLFMQQMCDMRPNLPAQKQQTGKQLLLYLSTILVREQREGNAS